MKTVIYLTEKDLEKINKSFNRMKEQNLNHNKKTIYSFSGQSTQSESRNQECCLFIRFNESLKYV